MKLENLKTKKFEQFEKSKVSDMMSIRGGEEVGTSIRGRADARDYDTDNGNRDGAGTRWDFYRNRGPQSDGVPGNDGSPGQP